MAGPVTSQHLLITLGDGGDPTETFAFPCGANTRSFQLTNNLGEEALLDCDNPLGVPAAITRWVESHDSQVTISGRVDINSWNTWRAWSDTATTKNIRIEILNTVAENGGYYQMPAIVQDMELSATGSSTVEFSATIVQNGTRTWTAAT